jgi:CubicO group peptidase (beta-lactamase class C family)
MTGGIPHDRWQQPIGKASRGTGTDALLAVYGGPVSRPSEQFLYSNMSFGALEVVIEHGSSRPFGDFLRDDVFGPLRMSRSGAVPDPGWPAAWKYDGKGGVWRPTRNYVGRMEAVEVGGANMLPRLAGSWAGAV